MRQSIINSAKEVMFIRRLSVCLFVCHVKSTDQIQIHFVELVARRLKIKKLNIGTVQQNNAIQDKK